MNVDHAMLSFHADKRGVYTPNRVITTLLTGVEAKYSTGYVSSMLPSTLGACLTVTTLGTHIPTTILKTATLRLVKEGERHLY